MLIECNVNYVVAFKRLIMLLLAVRAERERAVCAVQLKLYVSAVKAARQTI